MAVMPSVTLLVSLCSENEAFLGLAGVWKTKKNEQTSERVCGPLQSSIYYYNITISYITVVICSAVGTEFKLYSKSNMVYDKCIIVVYKCVHTFMYEMNTNV